MSKKCLIYLLTQTVLQKKIFFIIIAKLFSVSMIKLDSHCSQHMVFKKMFKRKKKEFGYIYNIIKNKVEIINGLLLLAYQFQVFI